MEPDGTSPTNCASQETSPSSSCRPTALSLRGSASKPVERVWLVLRERHLSHRLLAGYDAIVDALCTACDALSPERLLSLTNYPYLNQVSF